MFSSGPDYNKLKTNLCLALNRLKLLEKKKTELAQKARKEIGDYLIANKTERARIRVEHIIREDYLVEAMEMVEMFCDMILARFGLVRHMKELDAGIAEAVYSLVWVCPRLQTDVTELSVISEIFCKKYGPQFTESARTATSDHHVSEKLMNKLQLQAPPKLLVEKYLIEIAKIYNIEYTPDPQVMQDDSKQEHHLIDLSDRNNLGGGGGPPPQMGFIGYPSVPSLPDMPNVNSKSFNYPPPFGGPGGSGGDIAAGGASIGASPSAPFAYNIPPSASGGNQATSAAGPGPSNVNTKFLNNETNQFVSSNTGSGSKATEAARGNSSPEENILRPKLQHEDPPPRYSSINPMNLQQSNKPKPQPRMKIMPENPKPDNNLTNLDLPTVPNDLPGSIENENTENDDEIDFDDLSRRFENLKKHP